MYTLITFNDRPSQSCLCGAQMRTLTIHASVVVFLLASNIISVCVAHLRVGAFNIRVFGRKKVADQVVVDILVQVFGGLQYITQICRRNAHCLDDILTFNI